jgi:hypothetical protein
VSFLGEHCESERVRKRLWIKWLWRLGRDDEDDREVECWWGELLGSLHSRLMILGKENCRTSECRVFTDDLRFACIESAVRQRPHANDRDAMTSRIHTSTFYPDVHIAAMNTD